jgi:hypothetical protein
MRRAVTAGLLLGCAAALCQQLAFTSRAYVQSPVSIVSVEASKEFVFESAVLRNDGNAAAKAVRFRITVHAAGAVDEIADDRRLPINLKPQETRRVALGLGHIQGLRQQAKSRKQESALAIITVEAVEFDDGREWKRPDTDLKLDSYPDRIEKK